MRANFDKLRELDPSLTSAEDILSRGYLNWVNDRVGYGLENGLYKLTATFTNTPQETVWLDVGDYTVAVTNAGEYVFLLGKGHRYTFGTNPYLETVRYLLVDDLAFQGRVLRAAGAWGENGVWSVAGGAISFVSQTQMLMGELHWQPTFRGYPNVVHIGPDDSPVSFSAILTDIAPDIAAEDFYWTASPPLVLSSRRGREVSIQDADFPSWSEISLNVTARLLGEELTSSIAFTYGTNSTPQVGIGLSLPPALLLREDWIENSQSAIARVTFSSDIETNGAIRVSLSSGSDKVSVHQSGLGSHAFGDASEYEISFPIDGTAVSSYVDDVTMLCEYLDANGEVASSVSSSLTVVSPKRISVNNDAVQDVAVVVDSAVSATIIAEPSSMVIPETRWYDAKLRVDRTYTGWREWSEIGESITRTMSEGGIFVVKARVVFPGPQWADVFYAWTEDEDPRIGFHIVGDANHIGVASTQEQLDLRSAARSALGSTAYARHATLPARNGFSAVGTGKWKCNAFVADTAIAANLTVPIQHTTGILDANTYPPVANEWAIGNVLIRGWSHLGPAVWPEPGLIVAHPSAVGSGHVGIVDYDGEGVAAGERTVNRRYENFLDGSSGYNLYEGESQ